MIAKVGNWNDEVNGGDSRTTHRHPRAWKLIDRIVSFLYVRGF